MFGNLWTSRYSSLLNFTGVNERIALAKKANELFGNQFQLYGKNWDKVGLTSRECQLFEVSFEMQKYCLNIGWEHFYNIVITFLIDLQYLIHPERFIFLIHLSG